MKRDEKTEMVEVSVPRGTMGRYKDLIVKGTLLIVSANELFYVKKEDLAVFTLRKNTKRNR